MECVNCGYVWGNKGTEKFCCIQCREDYEEKNKKFEEIKQKAWEAILSTCTHNKRKKMWQFADNKDAWKLAESFCKFAKQKQEKTDV